MASRSDINARILELGLVAIIRTPSRELVLPACEAIINGGLTVVEVTMTVPNALEALRTMDDTVAP